MRRTKTELNIHLPEEPKTCHEPALKRDLHGLEQLIQELRERVLSIEDELWHRQELEDISESQDDD